MRSLMRERERAYAFRFRLCKRMKRDELSFVCHTKKKGEKNT